jgi:hypothetical protein
MLCSVNASMNKGLLLIAGALFASGVYVLATGEIPFQRLTGLWRVLPSGSAGHAIGAALAVGGMLLAWDTTRRR